MIPDNLALEVLDRDGHHCRHCGTSKSNAEANVQVSTIDVRKKTFAIHPSNLITLCESCKTEAILAQSNGSDKKKCGVLLAGGRGTRLAPLTLFANKHELPVGNIPMIFHPLLTLRTMNITDILVILDRDNAPERFVSMMGNGSEFGLDITYRVQQGAGGIADGLMLAKRFVGKRECYVILGDNIFDRTEFRGWQDMNWAHAGLCNNSSRACVFLKAVPNPKGYGIAEKMEGNRVLNIREKPQDPKTNLAVVGLYIYSSDVFDIIPELVPSHRGELEITAINNYYAAQGLLTSIQIKGFWGDAGGSTDAFLRVNEHMIRSD